jgi:hypothetical protein
MLGQSLNYAVWDSMSGIVFSDLAFVPGRVKDISAAINITTAPNTNAEERLPLASAANPASMGPKKRQTIARVEITPLPVPRTSGA